MTNVNKFNMAREENGECNCKQLEKTMNDWESESDACMKQMQQSCAGTWQTASAERHRKTVHRP